MNGEGGKNFLANKYGVKSSRDVIWRRSYPLAICD